MKEEDREIWIGENRFYLGEDNIIYETVVGEVDEKIAIAMEEASIKFRKMTEEKLDVLVDLNKAGKPTLKARQIARRRLDNERVGRVAIFGMNPVAKVVASFIMGVTKKKNMRFFKTKEEARTWIKSEDS